jgi:hypothetical protein
MTEELNNAQRDISPAALKLLAQLTHLILGAYHSRLALRPACARVVGFGLE